MFVILYIILLPILYFCQSQGCQQPFILLAYIMYVKGRANTLE